MKISIVVAYINRKKLLYQTLKSIAKTKYLDFEMIVVDDCSVPEERIEDFLPLFPFLKVIRLEPEDKWYTNTCVQYNIGFREAQGDIIIIQNAECLHVHDVISYLSEQVNDSNYVTISAYATSQEITKNLPLIIDNPNFLSYFKSLPQHITTGIIGWYNHSIYRPYYFHFCSGITRKNLDALGGFDERYAYGTAYEDNEFVERIKRMRLKMVIVDEVSVIHQWHPTCQYNHPNNEELLNRNMRLFLDVTSKETDYHVNNIKIK